MTFGGMRNFAQSIRENILDATTGVMSLGGELEDVAESVAGEIDDETFYKVYEEAIGDGVNYEFLFIDFHKKPNHKSMFRKKLDEYIIIDEIKNK
jgi:hypothetical protein